LVYSSDNNNSVNNGFFQLIYQNDGVYIVVYPPVGKGKRVEVNDVIERLSRKQVRSINKDMVEFAVLKADKNQIKIAEPQDEVKIDATANAMTSPDKMKGYISIQPPDNGRMLTADELLGVLNKNGIVYGINMNALQSLVNYPIYNEMICVAEGTPPVNGQNGKLEFFFNTKVESKPTILEDGRVDFRDLNLIESVQSGQKLCSLVPPSQGTPGRNVCGGIIPAVPGKPAVLPKGRNTVISDDKNSLISSIDGQVSYTDGKVNVFATYEVPADVDNTTGNINFIGNVLIRGNVLSGFVVEAGGSVEVWGVVEGAVIKASGDIILKRGMSGMGKGVLISGGDVVARYIENSTVEARGDIKSEAIMHSNIKCGNKLELSGRKGLLVGGSCKVGKEIEAKVIGSYLATATEVEVGVDPTIRERYKEVKNEIISMETDLRKAEQAITILKRLELSGALTPDKAEMMSKSIRTKVYISSKLQELNEELQQLEAKLQQDSYGKIKCYNYIYPGTKVTIGTSMLYVRENLQYCTLYRDGADIRAGAIDR
jgi:hypothetical protein